MKELHCFNTVVCLILLFYSKYCVVFKKKLSIELDLLSAEMPINELTTVLLVSTHIVCERLSVMQELAWV